jgi:hypothetical protein
MKSKVYDLPRIFLKDARKELAFVSLKPETKNCNFSLMDFLAITGLRLEDAGARALAVKTEKPHFGERDGNSTNWLTINN